MASRIVQFDIGCRDRAKSAPFYADVLGWTLGADVNEFASAIENAGLAGHLVSLGHEPHNYVLLYAEVEDIEAAASAAERTGGGKIIGPLPLPDGRRFAWLTDPEGTMVGVIDRKS